MIDGQVLKRFSPKIAAVVGVAILLVVAKSLGLFHLLLTPAALSHQLVTLGFWGYLAFVVAYAVLQPVGIPDTAFIVAAALIWPWPIAFALSMTGAVLASAAGFSFARFLARDWVAKRIPARMRKYDDALARRGFFTVFTMRLLMMPAPVLHAFFGASKIRFSTHLWACAAGYATPIFLISFFGQRLFDYLKNAPMKLWIGLGVAIPLGILMVWGLCRWHPWRNVEKPSNAQPLY